MTNRLLLLDRDGVINHDSPDFIKSPEEWHPIPKSLEAIARFKQQGWLVAVITNQSGIGRGLYTEQTLEAIHQKFKQALRAQNVDIDGIFYCPHLPDADCNCRKPKPGLIQQALQTFNINPQSAPVPLIGDSLRDLIAASAAQCHPVLVKTGNGQKTLANHPEYCENIPLFDNLWEVAEHYLSPPRPTQ